MHGVTMTRIEGRKQ